MRHARCYLKSVCKPILLGLLALALVPNFCLAFKIGPDVEKPEVTFTRSGERISARLLPRAKSSRIEINFTAKTGRLAEVKAYDWDAAVRPEVDVKNFKSSLFEIVIDNLSPGAEAAVSISSDFFISSTEFYVFNPNREPAWSKDTGVENISRPERVQELIVKAADGGPMDADGAADGRVTIIGGPRDSFWGYALGTLFIRFFGIFLVLTILMIGMIVSGIIFKRIYRQKAAPKEVGGSAAPAPVAKRTATPENGEIPDMPDTEAELAAAVAAALQIHFARMHTEQPASLVANLLTPWTQQGRERIMQSRMHTFNRTRDH